MLDVFPLTPWLVQGPVYTCVMSGSGLGKQDLALLVHPVLYTVMYTALYSVECTCKYTTVQYLALLVHRVLYTVSV